MQSITRKLIFILLTSFLSFHQSVNAEKLIIAGDYWCPYNCKTDNDYPGFLIELAKESLRIYGINIEYRIMPWHQALKKVQTGEIDAVVGISDIRGRNLITTQTPLEYSLTSSFVRSDNFWVYDGSSSLNGKKIGIVMDYILSDDINNFIGITYPVNPQMFEIEDGSEAVINSIRNLLEGKIDVYFEDSRVVYHYLMNNKLTPYVKNAGSVGRKKLPLYLAFNKDLPQAANYVKFLEEGISSLKSSGEYDYLKDKYQIDNYQE